MASGIWLDINPFVVLGSLWYLQNFASIQVKATSETIRHIFRNITLLLSPWFKSQMYNYEGRMFIRCQKQLTPLFSLFGPQ